MLSMYYTKLLIQGFLLLIITACSSTTPLEKNSETKQSQKISHPTKRQLSIYADALIALNNNDLDKAQTLFTKMSKLQPNIAGAWANLALVSIKKEQYSEAERLINIALQKNPQMPQALNISGILAQKNGNIIEAKSLYQQAITYNPNYSLAHYNLALVYDIYLQDIANAIKHYQFYLQNIKGKDEQTAEWLATLQATMGNK